MPRSYLLHRHARRSWSFLVTSTTVARPSQSLDEGSYSDIGGPLHLMTIEEEEEEEDPPEPTTELPPSEALAIYDAEIRRN
jgi:hypothetical protein